MDDLDLKKIQSLLKQIANKDRQAFNQIFQHYNKALFSFIRKRGINYQMAEEALHDTFMVVWNKPNSFNNNAKFYTWLCGIAKRRAADLQRKQLKYAADESDKTLLDNIEDFSWNTIKNNEDTELSQIMDGCIEKLPIKYRTVLNLVHYEDMGYKKIAEALKIPEGTIKSRMAGARTKVKNCLTLAYTGIQLWREQ